MIPPSETHTWREVFRVRAYEVGPDQRLTIASLCNYLQEVAGNHAHALGVSLLQQPGMTWMLNRLHVRPIRMPAWQDDVYVDTWPSGHNGLLAWREFVVRDTAGELLAVGSSAWLMIDIARRRPVRLAASIDAIPLPDLPRPIADPFPKLAPPEAPVHHAAFEVYAGDLDQNGHANNVSFVGWAINTLPVESPALGSFEIDFRAEARRGDRVVSEACEAEGGILHALYRLEGDARRLLAVARSSFRESPS